MLNLGSEMVFLLEHQFREQQTPDAKRLLTETI